MTRQTPSLPQAVLTTALVLLRGDGHNAFADELEAVLSRMGGEAVPAWQPIETAPKDGREMFVVRGFNVTNENAHVRNYTTDPYCVWPGDDGGWVRWPHTFPPTHWMPLPAAPTAPAQQAARSMECEDCGGAGVVGEAYGGSEFQPPERDRCESCGGSGRWSQQAADVQGEPMQGLADYLRCASGGQFVGEPAAATLQQWAREVEAAAAQSVPKAGALQIRSWIDTAIESLTDGGTGSKALAIANLRKAQSALAASAPTVGPDEFMCPLCFDDPANIAAQEPSGCPCGDASDGLRCPGPDGRPLCADKEPSAAAEPVAGLSLAVIGRKHFGNPIPPEWYAAARELLATPPTPPSAPAGAGEGDAAVWTVARKAVALLGECIRHLGPEQHELRERIDALTGATRIDRAARAGGEQ